MDTEELNGRKAFVTGGTGFIGEAVICELLKEGWAVTALCRDRGRALATDWGKNVIAQNSSPKPGQVRVVVGNASNVDDVEQGMRGASTAWYLLHSMSNKKKFSGQEITMSETFVKAAKSQHISRIIYLGGLHPSGEELSEHLASRVKVGQIVLDSGIPAAVLQAGVVIGEKSASYKMIRHLAERLPGIIGPSWISNQITPISVRNAVFYLVRAADLPPAISRTFDIGGSDSVPYSSLIQRYAKATNRLRRPSLHLSLYTPAIAAHAVGLLTPVSSVLARPLVGSLLHDTVVKETGIQTYLGLPPQGLDSYEKSVALATKDHPSSNWIKTVIWTGSAVAGCAVIGSFLVKPRTGRYTNVGKSSWQRAPDSFPGVWTALYADLAAVSSLVIADANENEDANGATSYKIALAINLALGVGWGALLSRSGNARLASIGAGVLALSSLDLVRRAFKSAPQRGIALAPYSAWTVAGTALSALNLRRKRGAKFSITRK